jgi:hypothetical protein
VLVCATLMSEREIAIATAARQVYNTQFVHTRRRASDADQAPALDAGDRCGDRARG